MTDGDFLKGISGLASLYNNVLDSFKYVQIASGPNLATSVLKLDNAQLRLSRWGDALGLSGGHVDEETALPPNVWSEKAKRDAEEKLGQILESFNTARENSDEGPAANDQDLNLMTWSLHERMRELSGKRMNGAFRPRQPKFVLSEGQLQILVDRITQRTKELVALVPAQEAKESELAAHEVYEFCGPFRSLNQAATGQDDLLVSALEKILKPGVGLIHNSPGYIRRCWAAAYAFIEQPHDLQHQGH